MKLLVMPTSETYSSIQLLLADDDSDDRYFFKRALKKLTFECELSEVVDGEQLMNSLNDTAHNLPEVVFLDINLPRMNGAECLLAIKQDPLLQHLPVVMYSTSLHQKEVDWFYNHGAHYYICKKESEAALVNVLQQCLSLLVASDFIAPAREKFVILQS